VIFSFFFLFFGSTVMSHLRSGELSASRARIVESASSAWRDVGEWRLLV
jgi:hypothetical protein